MKVFKKVKRIKKPNNKLRGYSDPKIHLIMIKDKTRTKAYKYAIEKNISSKDVVLDLGCGTGILSLFAAKKGCKKIYAVEKTKIIEAAIEVAKKNKLDKNIIFVKKDMFKFKPPEKIDVLIHEQIGSYVWNEDIIAKIKYARNNFLKKNSKMLPYKLELYLVPVSYKSELIKECDFWKRKRFDLDLSSLGDKFLLQNISNIIFPFIIELKNTDSFICKEKLAHVLDLRYEDKIPKKITASFKLKKGSKLRGMCAFFKVYFDKKIMFSTRPQKNETHWGQIFIPCFKEKTINKKTCLNFTLYPTKHHKKWRFKFELD